MNVCSYHLQEAGATPVQELAFALATAIAVLDTVKASGEVPAEEFGEVVGRISFFVNAGLRFVTEICKMRAFVELWDEITRERYGVTDPKQRLFRYGVQVNSLGLTEQQPENNVYRILLEMLAVTLSKNARARAVQLPAWNEALGLPRPWDQQWSLRMQQILAYETDLLEYGDIFDGSAEIDAQGRGAEARGARRARAHRRDGRRGRRGRDRLHEASSWSRSNAARARSDRDAASRSWSASTRYHRDRALAARRRRRRDPDRVRRTVETEQIAAAEGLARGARRQGGAAGAGRARTRRRARAATSCRPRSPAPRPASPPANGAGPCARRSANTARRPASARAMRNDVGAARRRARRGRRACRGKLGRRLKFLVGKPGLDGHSNGAEQIAVRARDAGMEVVYEGIRLTPGRDRRRGARGEGARGRAVDPVGQPCAAGAGRGRAPDARPGIDDVPVVVGGIIPPEDAERAGAGRRRRASTRRRISS